MKSDNCRSIVSLQLLLFYYHLQESVLLSKLSIVWSTLALVTFKSSRLYQSFAISWFWSTLGNFLMNGNIMKIRLTTLLILSKSNLKSIFIWTEIFERSSWKLFLILSKLILTETFSFFSKRSSTFLPYINISKNISLWTEIFGRLFPWG